MNHQTVLTTVVITDDNGVIQEFEEKPEHPRSNKASMGIYIFNWKLLKDKLIEMKDVPSCDFGKHVIPSCHEAFFLVHLLSILHSRLRMVQYKPYQDDASISILTLQLAYMMTICQDSAH